jgi:hypothetical protein
MIYSVCTSSEDMVQPSYRFKAYHSFIDALLNKGRSSRFVAYCEFVSVTRYSASNMMTNGG